MRLKWELEPPESIPAAQGRGGVFISSAFPYDVEHDIYLCPAGQQLTHKTVINRGHGVLTRSSSLAMNQSGRLGRRNHACRLWQMLVTTSRLVASGLVASGRFRESASSVLPKLP